LNGYDIPAEFSDESHKREVDSDIGKFNTLGEYTPKKICRIRSWFSKFKFGNHKVNFKSCLRQQT